MTKAPERRDRSLVTSSVIPSANQSWSELPLRLAKGNTTRDNRGTLIGCFASDDWGWVGAEVSREVKPIQMAATRSRTAAREPATSRADRRCFGRGRGRDAAGAVISAIIAAGSV